MHLRLRTARSTHLYNRITFVKLLAEASASLLLKASLWLHFAIYTMAEVDRARWPAIESDPESFSEMLHSLGLPKDWQFTEVLGLDEELLSFVPGPAKALILCYPHDGSLTVDKSSGTAATDGKLPFFLRQLQPLGNACGTIACIHAALNAGDVELEHGPLRAYRDRTAALSPEDRGHELDGDDVIREAHSAAAVQGSGGIEAGQADVNHHYVCFVHTDGRLFELDGLEDAPISYGHTIEDQLLHDAAFIIRAKYTDKNPDGTFALMALTKGDI